MKPGEIQLSEEENKFLDEILSSYNTPIDKALSELVWGNYDKASLLQMIRAKVRLALYRGRG